MKLSSHVLHIWSGALRTFLLSLQPSLSGGNGTVFVELRSPPSPPLRVCRLHFKLLHAFFSSAECAREIPRPHCWMAGNSELPLLGIRSTELWSGINNPGRCCEWWQQQQQRPTGHPRSFQSLLASRASSGRKQSATQPAGRTDGRLSICSPPYSACCGRSLEVDASRC